MSAAVWLCPVDRSRLVKVSSGRACLECGRIWAPAELLSKRAEMVAVEAPLDLFAAK